MSSFSRRILVTGGAGFIGANFIRYLLRERPGWSVTNYDALTYAGNPASLEDVAGSDRYRFLHADIRDPEPMLETVRACDVVVHFAAESHVDRSIVDSSPFVSTNVAGTQVLLDACLAAGTVERFVHVSTDEVYGELPLDRANLKFTEDSPLRPNSPYAATKTASDLLALAYRHTFQLPVVVTRCSNNFGPFQYPEKVIPLFVTNLIDGLKVPLYGDGRNVRDWIHVLDHCEAVLAVLERGRIGEVYNIGADNERSNIELTRAILELFGAGDEMIEPVSDRPGHDRRYAVDATKCRRDLGWAPSRSTWPDALADTVRWYREHEGWWRPLKKQPAKAG